MKMVPRIPKYPSSASTHGTPSGWHKHHTGRQPRGGMVLFGGAHPYVIRLSPSLHQCPFWLQDSMQGIFQRLVFLVSWSGTAPQPLPVSLILLDPDQVFVGGAVSSLLWGMSQRCLLVTHPTHLLCEEIAVPVQETVIHCSPCLGAGGVKRHLLKRDHILTRILL